MRPLRRRLDSGFRKLCALSTLLSVFVLAVLLSHIGIEGWDKLNFDFLQNYPSRFPDKAGLLPALYGTAWLLILTIVIAVPLGVATAVFLEEYANPRSKLVWLLRVNISSLAGMPSIVYGLLGLAIFVRYLAWDRSILSGAATLSLLVLPVIIIAARESIRAVPNSLREAGYALGARKWQVVWGQVLPASLPGIMTGTILAMSRALGEAAPMLIIGGAGYISFLPSGPLSGFTSLPIQIYNWAARPQPEFHQVAGAGIVVLLGVLFLMNSVAVYIRNHFQRYKL